MGLAARLADHERALRRLGGVLGPAPGGLHRPLHHRQGLDGRRAVDVGGQGQAQGRHDQDAERAGQHEGRGEGGAHGPGVDGDLHNGYFVRVDPSVHAGEVWKVKIDILDAQPGETFTYHWQSGFPHDNTWVHLEDKSARRCNQANGAARQRGRR